MTLQRALFLPVAVQVTVSCPITLDPIRSLSWSMLPVFVLLVLTLTEVSLITLGFARAGLAAIILSAAATIWDIASHHWRALHAMGLCVERTRAN